MKKILVTTDSSSLGHSALPHAEQLAKALGAQLVVLMVQPDPATVLIGEFPSAVAVDMQDLLAETQAIKQELERRMPAAHVLVELARGRTVAQSILDVAKRESVQMIVMTTHGRSGLGRVLLGSVAEAVVHTSPIPVLLVKGEQPATDWAQLK